MAAPDPGLALMGPPQRGQGCNGQYVYWIVMPYPLPEPVASTQIKTPDECRKTHKYRLVVVRFPSEMDFGDAPVCGTILFAHNYGPQVVKVSQIIVKRHPYL